MSSPLDLSNLNVPPIAPTTAGQGGQAGAGGSGVGSVANTLAVGPWRSPPQNAIVNASNRTYTVSLFDPDQVTFNINGAMPDALYVQEAISDLKWTRGGTPVGLFRCTDATDTGDSNAPGSHVVQTTWTDYRGVLDRRHIIGDYTGANNGSRTFTNASRLEDVAWWIIDHIQSQPGGNLGITKGLWPVTGQYVKAPYVQFQDGDSAWKCLKTLMANPNAFELYIDANKKANLYYPARGGTDKGAVLDFRGTVSKFQRTVSTSSYGNFVRQSGQQPSAPVTLQVPDLLTRPEGRWDQNFSDTSLFTPAMISDAAAYNYALSSQLLPTYTLTMKLGAWGGPSHIWVGDIVTVVIQSGRLNVNDKLRVYQIQVTLDANNQETVVVTTGRPPNKSPFAKLAATVAYLSKR